MTVSTHATTVSDGAPVPTVGDVLRFLVTAGPYRTEGLQRAHLAAIDLAEAQGVFGPLPDTTPAADPAPPVEDPAPPAADTTTASPAADPAPAVDTQAPAPEPQPTDPAAGSTGDPAGQAGGEDGTAAATPVPAP